MKQLLRYNFSKGERFAYDIQFEMVEREPGTSDDDPTAEAARFNLRNQLEVIDVKDGHFLFELTEISNKKPAPGPRRFSHDNQGASRRDPADTTGFEPPLRLPAAAVGAGDTWVIADGLVGNVQSLDQREGGLVAVLTSDARLDGTAPAISEGRVKSEFLFCLTRGRLLQTRTLTKILRNDGSRMFSSYISKLG